MERLFNVMPPDLRNITGVKTETFKRHLDVWLQMVPDTPKIDDYDGRCDIMKRGTLNGRTALHNAVSSNLVQTAQLLLEYGGDRLLKVKSREKESAFDLAETEQMRQVLTSYKGKKGKIDMITGAAETTKRNGGLQLSQLSHTSLLTNKEECQAFILLLLNTYLNTTGFRYLLVEIKRGHRRSTSVERMRRRRAMQMTNNEFCDKEKHDLLSDNGKEDVTKEQIDGTTRSHELIPVLKSPSSGDQKRKSIDANCENKNYENDTKGTAFILFRRKNIKEMPTRTNSQQLENYEDLLVPSDKTEAKNMNDIFYSYLKDVETFKARKEELSNSSLDSDFLNSLNFILQF
ncbi:unnamed protein product, partial [Meganyctiphanes norvegica]